MNQEKLHTSRLIEDDIVDKNDAGDEVDKVDEDNDLQTLAVLNLTEMKYNV